MVLGNRHENRFRVPGNNIDQVLSAIEEAVQIAVMFGGTDFDEVVVIEQADARISPVGKQVREKDGFALDESATRCPVIGKPRCSPIQLRTTERAISAVMRIGWGCRKIFGARLFFLLACKSDPAFTARDGMGANLNRPFDRFTPRTDHPGRNRFQFKKEQP